MHIVFELDSEEMVEEQALAFVRNLVYGSVDLNIHEIRINAKLISE